MALDKVQQVLVIAKQLSVSNWFYSRTLDYLSLVDMEVTNFVTRKHLHVF